MSPAGSTDAAGINTFDAQWVILCNDEVERLDSAQANGLATELDALAPRTGLGVAMTWGLGCQAFDPPTAPVGAFEMEAAAPVLVVGSTGDPARPTPGQSAWRRRSAARGS